MAQVQAPSAPSSGGNKKTIILIVVIVIVVCVVGAGVGGYLIFRKIKTAAKNKIEQTLTNPAENGDLLNKLSEEADNSDEAAEDFKRVEDVEIADSYLKTLDSSFRPVLTSVFGEVKITNYQTDYLGLDMGQQFLEYTVSRNIVARDLNAILSSLKQAGYTVGSSNQDKDGASILAEKSGVSLEITYWHDDSTIGVVITPVVKDETNGDGTAE
ncbi:MAG: hypothetical protein PHW01_03435 [Patescibacteria group bacterium]|nr:hypothetical protein [Patescibacteria group bacterium]